ncbi:hypothetical protein Fcan01_08193 [Folsomia candida]|uniref:Uncharacterized protein n=1 Tax=Folsomia candida TaxID=158441 RepID=A0A226EJL0_FOLCA|nr:hypothetical protein Fcan01_08193 [Folsomia candida]
MRSTAVLRWSVGPLRRGESALKDIYNCRLEIFYNCGKAVGKSLVHSGNNGGRGKSKKEMDKVRVKWVNGVHGLRQLRKKSSLPSCWRWMEEKTQEYYGYYHMQLKIEELCESGQIFHPLLPHRHFRRRKQVFNCYSLRFDLWLTGEGDEVWHYILQIKLSGDTTLDRMNHDTSQLSYIKIEGLRQVLAC